MTRDEAYKICKKHRLLHCIADALIELGVLKVDDPPKSELLINIPCVQTCSGLAIVRLDTAIETLRMAGYDVEMRKPGP